jgi:hypothetical protein
MSRRRPGSTKTKTSRFGVYLSPATRTALLKAALDTNVSATALVEGLIRQYLRKQRKGTR